MQWARTIRRLAGGSVALLLWGQCAGGEAIRGVRFTELFAQADRVVLVRIVSGDTEHYETAVYKAVVETAYKGATTGQVVYFGPYVGLGVGAEYVVFLQGGTAVKPKDTGGLSFGAVQEVGKMMYAGYSALPVGYECVFDEQPVKGRCDDSVEVNPEQIVLPKTVRTYPRHEPGPITNYKVWVRRSDMLPLLQRLSKMEKPSGAGLGR